MATLKDNLSYFAFDIAEQVSDYKSNAAQLFEDKMREQITSGEGQDAYSTKSVWMNIRRIPRFANTLTAYARARDLKSRFGGASVLFDNGYAEYREALGKQAQKKDYMLTGEFVNSLIGRARHRAGGGLHIWLGFNTQKRKYDRISNRDLAGIISDKARVDPFRTDEVGPEVADALMRLVFGAR